MRRAAFKILLRTASDAPVGRHLVECGARIGKRPFRIGKLILRVAPFA